MLIIGELINSTRKAVRKAVEEKDAAFIQDLAKKQVEAGANWIDVNAGAFPTDEVEKMQWLIIDRPPGHRRPPVHRLPPAGSRRGRAGHGGRRAVPELHLRGVGSLQDPDPAW